MKDEEIKIEKIEFSGGRVMKTKVWDVFVFIITDKVSED
jgi:hypothetical protein